MRTPSGRRRRQRLGRETVRERPRERACAPRDDRRTSAEETVLALQELRQLLALADARVANQLAQPGVHLRACRCGPDRTSRNGKARNQRCVARLTLHKVVHLGGRNLCGRHYGGLWKRRYDNPRRQLAVQVHEAATQARSRFSVHCSVARGDVRGPPKADSLFVALGQIRDSAVDVRVKRVQRLQLRGRVRQAHCAAPEPGQGRASVPAERTAARKATRRAGPRPPRRWWVAACGACSWGPQSLSSRRPTRRSELPQSNGRTVAVAVVPYGWIACNHSRKGAACCPRAYVLHAGVRGDLMEQLWLREQLGSTPGLPRFSSRYSAAIAATQTR
jgi:hypothetical protein